jgi:hypothetical protein
VGSGVDLIWSDDHDPDQPGQASLRFVGGKNPLHGAYLTTGPNAPLNAETFRGGYTFEVFLKIPLDWDSNNNGFMPALTRLGQAGDAGKSGRNTDPNEPLCGLFISNNGREPQFNFYPRARPSRPPTGARACRRSSGGTWPWSTTAGARSCT